MTSTHIPLLLRTGAVSLLVLLVTFAKAGGQDFDRMLSRPVINCENISYNSATHYVRYMEADQPDSAAYLLDYWQEKCGMREPVFRAQVLLLLYESSFMSELIDDATFNQLQSYKARKEMIRNASYYSYDNYPSYFGYVPPGQEFDNYTARLAKQLMGVYDPNTVPYLLAEFYGVDQDTLFDRIQEDAFEGTALRSIYDRRVAEYVALPEFHVSWITGAWIPTGDASILGTHPDLGFQMGAKVRRMNYDATMTFKFADSPNTYLAYRNSSDATPEPTNHFFGGHIGFDIGYDLLARKGHEIQATGGVALEGFDALEGNDDIGLSAASTFTYDLNMGLGYRYYVTNSFYLGLRAKYHVVDYTLNNIVDFTGNPVTLQFIVGAVDSPIRNGNLKNLHYPLRK